MKNAIRIGLLALVALIGVGGSALAEKRVALVIGNGAYLNAPQLPNPPRDAHAMADKLKAMGFQVVEGYDLDKSHMTDTVQQFARAVVGADVGVFYYAGHGMQLNNDNYIVPVDAKLEDSLSVDFEITKVAFVIDQMSRDVKLKIALLDACRDNPLSRSLAAGSRAIAVTGLADMKVVNRHVTDGSLIAFATDPGSIALDGKGDHSPFTQALLQNIDGNASLSSVMNQVTSDVLKITENHQRPWVQASLTGDVFLNPVVASDAQPLKIAPAFASPKPPQADDAVALGRENALWAAAKQSGTIEDYQAYLQQYPDGLYAGLAKNGIERSKQAMLTPATSLAPAAAIPAPVLSQAPSSVETEAALDLDPARQRMIQLHLKQAGYDPGKVNGSFSAKTRMAIGKWQAAHGVVVTTYLNEEQYKFLGSVSSGDAVEDTVKPPSLAAPYAVPRKARPVVVYQRPRAVIVRHYAQPGPGAGGRALMRVFGGALGGMLRRF